MTKKYDLSEESKRAVAPVDTDKTRISIRIDDDVLEWFRNQAHEAGGGSSQTLMNQALREHMDRDAEVLEDTLRRVLREVLPKTAAKKKTAKKKKAPKKKKKATRKTRR